MFSLVTGVKDYPHFLPWCDRAQVVQQHADGVTAQLSIAFAGVHQAFTTRNTHEDNHAVHMKLVDGPFSSLEGSWVFTPLQKPVAPNGQQGDAADAAACKVEFTLRYAFASRALSLVVSPVFDRIANTFVEAFVKRAEQVYGKR
jgi:ribosome-associated toxin RatA of RatAB toxin-antitoxin module